MHLDHLRSKRALVVRETISWHVTAVVFLRWLVSKLLVFDSILAELFFPRSPDQVDCTEHDTLLYSSVTSLEEYSIRNTAMYRWGITSLWMPRAGSVTDAVKATYSYCHGHSCKLKVVGGATRQTIQQVPDITTITSVRHLLSGVVVCIVMSYSVSLCSVVCSQ